MTLRISMLAFALTASAWAFERPAREGGAPRIYIEPQNGFDSYIAAAIVKKHVPAVVTQNKEEAQFVLTSVVLSKEETTGGKIARCLFLYCAGAEGTQTATFN